MFGTEATTTWPQAVIFLGVLLTAMFLIGIAIATFLEFRKTKLVAEQEATLRQLVHRYEKLAETTLFVGQKLRSLVSKERKEDLQVLRELIEAGKVTPVIDRTYPLSEVPEAIRYWGQGHARGKVVITVSRT
jgi:NADPH:quinone reductase-like Zn-dependent oxidoreductase